MSHRWWPAYAPPLAPVLLRGRQLSRFIAFRVPPAFRICPLMGEQRQKSCHPPWPAVLSGKDTARGNRGGRGATLNSPPPCGGRFRVATASRGAPCPSSPAEMPKKSQAWVVPVGGHATASVGGGSGAAVGLGSAGRRGRASPPPAVVGRAQPTTMTVRGVHPLHQQPAIPSGGRGAPVAARRRRRRQFLRGRGAPATAADGRHVGAAVAVVRTSGRGGGGGFLGIGACARGQQYPATLAAQGTVNGGGRGGGSGGGGQRWCRWRYHMPATPASHRGDTARWQPAARYQPAARCQPAALAQRDCS